MFYRFIILFFFDLFKIFIIEFAYVRPLIINKPKKCKKIGLFSVVLLHIQYLKNQSDLCNSHSHQHASILLISLIYIIYTSILLNYAYNKHVGSEDAYISIRDKILMMRIRTNLLILKKWNYSQLMPLNCIITIKYVVTIFITPKIVPRSMVKQQTAVNLTSQCSMNRINRESFFNEFVSHFIPPSISSCIW